MSQVQEECALVEGTTYKSFKIIRVQPVPEIACTLVEVVHLPSGAKILHIQNDDPENLFCLSFQTVPSSSNGVAHVLEHLVLCGSEKYPVRDPFFSMGRRSLNTFMNAFTGSDFTCYPAASQIEKDFYNLLDVYIDAVFHPKLNHFSFLQEAHRLEFTGNGNHSSPLTRTGVVFSEMKGAYGQPLRRLSYQMDSLLFQNSPYRHDSGGRPEEIPSLTLDQVRKFHETFYHPSRCLFFFYGNLPLKGHLDALEHHILHNASKLPALPAFPRQPRFSSPKTGAITYPLEEGAESDKKGYLSFGFLTTDITNQLDLLGLTILDIILLGHDAAPLKKALLDTGKCTQVSSSLETQTSEAPFVITAMGLNVEDAHILEKVFFQTLQRIADDGIPPEKIAPALHEVELAKSEIGSDDAPFGLSLYFRSGLFMHHLVDPMIGLEIHRLFDALHEAVREKPTYFSTLINKYLLNNSHRVVLTMAPSSALEAEERAEELQRIASISSTLSKKDKEVICTETEKLHDLQEEEQNLDCLPSLHLQDVPKNGLQIDIASETIGNFPCYSHATFTNHISYIDFATPLPKMEKENLWLLSLFFYLMPQLGCGTKNYEETLFDLHAYTGGIYASLAFNTQAKNCNTILPALQLQGKALDRNVNRLCSMMTQMLTNLRLDETARIEQLVKKLHTSLERSLQKKALDYALLESSVGLSEPLAIANELYGLPYVHHIRGLATAYGAKEAALLEDLSRLKEALTPNTGSELIVTTSQTTLNALKEENFYGLCEIPGRLVHPFENLSSKPTPKTSRGYIISSCVGYTALSCKTVPYTHNDSPALAVVAQLMDDCFLHKHLREQGGAYGGGAKSGTTQGSFSFYSYKDPNLFTTLQAYEASARFIKEGLFSDRELEEAKLGVFQDLDTPPSPGSKAQIAYTWHKQGKTKEIRQHWRDQLFAIDRTHIQALIDRYFSGVWKNSPFIAFSGKDLLENDQQAFIASGNEFQMVQT